MLTLQSKVHSVFNVNNKPRIREVNDYDRKLKNVLLKVDMERYTSSTVQSLKPLPSPVSHSGVLLGASPTSPSLSVDF